MHQNAFGGRAAPSPAGGVYSASPDPLAELKEEGSGKWRGEGGEEKGREEGKRERKEGKGRTPQCLKCVDANGG